MAGGTPTAGLEGAWGQFAIAFLNAIGAPTTCQANIDSLWAWTLREKPSGQPMQWNNPLNTTNPNYGGSCAFNVPNSSVCVQSYATPTNGGQANAQYLLNGRYNDIVKMFRTCTPVPDWSSAANQELGTWSGGGYTSLSGTYKQGAGPGAGLTGPGASGSGQSGAACAGGCSHCLDLRALVPGNNGPSICMDKPLAAIQIAGGVLILLVGTVILGAALIGGAFPGTKEAAKTVLPVGRVVKGARRVSAARRASQGRQQAATLRAQSAQVREARAGELHTQRVAKGRAQVRSSRARARITEAKAREARGRGEVVYLGGRPVRKSSLSPRMREAVEKAS